MNEHNSREAIVKRVAEAARAWQVDPPKPFAWSPRDDSPGTLLERFTRAAAGADATVSVVAGAEGARRRVAEILSALDVRAAIVEDALFNEPWHMGRLTDAGAACELHRASALAQTPAVTMARPALAGITAAQYGIAESGTLVVCSSPAGGRAASLLPAVHIALVSAAALVPALPQLLSALVRDGRLAGSSAVTLITGPSRTADVEMTLTIGVHGPRQLFTIVCRELPDPPIPD